MGKQRYKRVVVLVPVNLLPVVESKMKEQGFTKMGTYIKWLLMRELARQKKKGCVLGGQVA